VRCRVLQRQAPIDPKPSSSAKASPSSAAAAAEVLQLSARPSHGGMFAGVGQLAASTTSAARTPSTKPGRNSVSSGSSAPPSRTDAAPELVLVEDLAVGGKVRGYVKAVGANGLFMALDRVHDGRIRLRNLSDG